MPVVRLVPSSTSVLDAVRTTLEQDGWSVAPERDEPVDAVVFDPGLLAGLVEGDPAERLFDLLASTRFRSRDNGGGAVAVVGSRDQLGRPGHAATAAAAGALFSAARSLALEHASHGVTVNIVAGPSAGEDAPLGLLPEPAVAEDIAASVVFFIDPRSRYITGQLLFCDGGTSLLSSLSV